MYAICATIGLDNLADRFWVYVANLGGNGSKDAVRAFALGRGVICDLPAIDSKVHVRDQQIVLCPMRASMQTISHDGWQRVYASQLRLQD